MKNSHYYTLDYIVKENGRYFAHLREHDPTGTSKEIHTGTMYGWKGKTYNDLKKTLAEYNISLPPLKEMEIFKKTQHRKCYCTI